MASPSEFRRIRQRIVHVMEHDEELKRLVNTALQHHARDHHLDGMEGAARCLLGSGTRRSRTSGAQRAIPKKERSSYFHGFEDAMDAVYDCVLHGRKPDGRSNLNMLAGFLANAPVGERYVMTLDPDLMPEPCAYGRTLLQDVRQTTQKGAKGAIREVDATGATVIVEKTSEEGDFALRNLYPEPPDDSRQGQLTPPKELQARLEATQAYAMQVPIRQMEASLRIYQRDDTPSVYVRDAKLWIDFAEVGGPLVGVSDNHIESPGSKTQDQLIRTMRTTGLARQASAVLQLSQSCRAPRERSAIIATIMEPKAPDTGQPDLE